MSYRDYLIGLLEPLGVYKLEDSFNGAELTAVGAALDQVEELLEDSQREMNLVTAQNAGISAAASLLAHQPVTESTERLRIALAALLRVGGDSFTLAAINDNLSGCGLNTVVREAETVQTVAVSFPDVPGIPDGIDEMKKIVEDIIPCHLAIQYAYWYITWALMEERFETWGEVEALGLTWEGLEKLVM